MDQKMNKAVKTKDKAVELLLQLQSAEGWWKGELETNVSIEAEDIMMREFLGISDPQMINATAKWIRHQQREDGTWANFFGGPPELSTTFEAFVALCIAGDPPDAKHMLKTREFILDSGGLEKTRVFTRIWMALFGEWDWRKLPSSPPEIIFFPRWLPLNIYDFACWARQTLVPICVLTALRPKRAVLNFDISDLKTGAVPDEQKPRGIFTREGRMQLLDKTGHVYNRILASGLARPLRKAAIKKSEKWILERQEKDGSWGGIQPPWVYSTMALSVLGRSNDDPAILQSLKCLDEFTVYDRDMRRLECCQSPIWDTALAVVALADAGLPPDHPALKSAGEWLLSKEVTQKGDWSVRAPKLPPGGWSFEFENQNYPDVDDAAEVILALDRIEGIDSPGAIERGLKWLEGMQSSNGGYAAFDIDNDRSMCKYLPFCDFGEVIDPPTADVTAHSLEMLARLKDNPQYSVNPKKYESALKWLLKEQEEEDGSWFGRWGANYIYGTGAAVPALVDAGMKPTDGQIRKSLDWLARKQNQDGGWGEDMRSYRDLDWSGKGESTPSQTAWALLALISAESAAQDFAEKGFSKTTEAGIDWLVQNQNQDGGWDEPYFTGTGFPGDFYINYHLYRNVFPITALGRYVEALQKTSSEKKKSK